MKQVKLLTQPDLYSLLVGQYQDSINAAILELNAKVVQLGITTKFVVITLGHQDNYKDVFVANHITSLAKEAGFRAELKESRDGALIAWVHWDYIKPLAKFDGLGYPVVHGL